MLITNIYDDISAYFERIDKGIIWNYTKGEKACSVPQDGKFGIKFPLCQLVGFIKDGKKHGKWHVEWQKGTRTETGTEGEYKDGKKHGKWRYREYSLYHFLQYRSIAALMSEGEYRDGKKHGKWVYYRRDLYCKDDSFHTEMFSRFYRQDLVHEYDVFRFIKIYDNGELKQSFYECKKGKKLC